MIELIGGLDAFPAVIPPTQGGEISVPQTGPPGSQVEGPVANRNSSGGL